MNPNDKDHPYIILTLSKLEKILKDFEKPHLLTHHRVKSAISIQVESILRKLRRYPITLNKLKCVRLIDQIEQRISLFLTNHAIERSMALNEIARWRSI